MSLLSDLSRGASNLPRNIRNGASTIGRAVVSAADRYIGNGFRVLGNGVVRISQLSARSYGHGILVTYNQTGGNDAIKLSDTPIQPDALNPFELLLHRSFSLAWLFGLLASAAAHSYRNSIQVTLQTLNLALPIDMQLKQTYNDKRSVMLKYLLGFPGVLLGLPVSAIGFLTIVVGRVMSNSWETLLQFSMQLTNLALADEDKIKRADTRSLIRKYILGALGVIPGVLAGSVGFVAVSIGRVVSNSWQTMLQVSMQLTNIALADEDKIKRADTRSLIRKYVLGLPGLIPGVMAGSVGFVAVSIGRVVSNSWQTILQVSIQLTNIALADEDKIKREDKRSLIRKYILGAPGVIPGVLTGSVGFVAVSFGRVVSNSWETLYSISTLFTNLALAEEHKIKREDKRGLIRKFLIGAPGTLAGIVVGSIGFVTVCVFRILGNSLATMAYLTLETTRRFINAALAKEDSLESPHEDKRRLISKYILGIFGVMPGILVGTFTGIPGFTGVLIGRVLINSAKIFGDISGGIMNAALEREIFDGFSNKNTAERRWGLGFPGVVLATPVATIGIAIFAIRKLLPLTFGVATSPITALWRISRETWKYYNDLFRFAKPSQNYHTIESKLKNLFASLTAMGELPEGKGVKDVRPGPIYTEGFLKNLIKFVRKSLTFNQQTLAEQLLSKLVHQFKGSTGSSGQNQTTVTLDIDNIVNQSIRDLMAAYAGDSHWITPDSEKREMDKEIIAIGDYVKDYFRNSSSTVPTHIYSARRTADFFFGKHKTVAAANAPLIQNTPTAEI